MTKEEIIVEIVKLKVEAEERYERCHSIARSFENSGDKTSQKRYVEDACIWSEVDYLLKDLIAKIVK